MKGSYIKPTEHVFIGGKTGTGKTWTARKYLAGFDNVAVLDTKGEFAWPEVGFHREEKNGGVTYKVENPKEVTLVESIEKLSLANTPKIIYRPPFTELKPEFYDAFFQWVYLRRNTIVYIDEAMSVSPNPFVLPEYYKACLTRGRELGIGVWSASQRPSGIAQIILSESTHFFIFDLNMPQDRKKLAEISGAEEFLEKPGYRVFWYYNVNQDHAVLTQIREKRG